MGTSLFIYGNHAIDFKNKSLEKVLIEIKNKLDCYNISNARLLWLSHLNGLNVRGIRSLKKRYEWTYEIYDCRYESDNPDCIYVEFQGPFNLQLIFDEYKIHFYNPEYDFWSFFHGIEDLHREEWRKYYCQIVKLFGGNRIIYFGDHSHFLSEFVDYEGSFDDMEREIYKKHGKPKDSYQDFLEDPNYYYYIDDFKCLNWGISEPIEKYLPEPDDTSKTDFDLKKYSRKKVLKTVPFDNEILLHKKINKKNHFYHLAVYEGLLCIHAGFVGEKHNFEVLIDKYAPFKYDELEEKIEKDGYNNKLYQEYFIVFPHGYSSSWRNALDLFYKEIWWAGIGEKGHWNKDDEGIYSFSFYSVDFDLAGKILKKVRKELKTIGRIHISSSNNKHKKIKIFTKKQKGVCFYPPEKKKEPPEPYYFVIPLK